MSSGLTFVILVYSLAIAYAGFKAGAAYGTIPAMKDRFLAWVSSLASKK